MSKKEDTIGRSFKKCGITLVLDGSENVNLNVEGLELQLQSELFSCEEEQENI